MATSSNVNGKRPAVDSTQNNPGTVKSRFKKLIDVCVGSPVEVFPVHMNVICDRSAFFKARCSEWWSGTSTGMVELSDHEPQTFALYLEWVYNPTSSLSGKARELVDADVMQDEAAQKLDVCRQLCRLWAMADYLMDKGCKHQVISTFMLYGWLQVFVSDKSSHGIVYTTPPGSALRRLLVRCVLPQVTPEYLQTNWDVFPEDMARDLFKAFVNTKGIYRPAHLLPPAADMKQFFD